MSSYQSSRTTVKRIPKRGHYDPETVHEVLDAHFICQVGFVYEGVPMIIPTMYGRDGGSLYLHGSAASRMLSSIVSQEICINVTLVDELVLARSLFHHSLNYRSAVVISRPELLESDEDKNHGLKIISDHMLSGRWEDARLPSPNELKATHVLHCPIKEASAKIRNTGVGDDPRDADYPVWAGTVPLNTIVGEPKRDSDLSEDQAMPSYLSDKVGKTLKT